MVCMYLIHFIIENIFYYKWVGDGDGGRGLDGLVGAVDSWNYLLFGLHTS